ncbi:P-loop containing nucleoside triphosphate hydrolase protein [Polyplosphaeria fusca]|uniref:Ribosome-releasing factor 2, mitochondrial n=1 Tax=Polyplosphaeria fusca TaxID=682080 RepID=A0A9P4R0D7_9PLEO|nr:P-loop containing nucleoside triphosphate hydrolase protein [Polyplosphaeria fusca]
MRLVWLWRSHRAARCNVTVQRRLLSSQANTQNVALSTTRNIGIIAHIDAGKTTTTERMLYYSGYTRRIGDVDEGSTVTDFLPAERARGITIQSAAITFHWPPLNPQQSGQEAPASFETIPRSSISHNINLIDTPGHADFTFEVLRSLRVLDGAVCILDGVAGVEAQTEKVWLQAGLYSIPRIIFVNKLDRVGAAFARTVKEIGARLHVWPAVCQIPWWQDQNGDFVGVGDIVNLRGMLWRGATDGSQIQAFSIGELESSHADFAAEMKKARAALVELLSEHDDGMVESFLEHDEDHLAIPGPQILESLRRVVLHPEQSVIPVFCGASFRNIGVQPLLDAVVDLLPSPLERPDPEISSGTRSGTLKHLVDSTSSIPASKVSKPKKSDSSTKEGSSTLDLANLQACALAFKVVSDPRRGVLVYVRCYSGSINRGVNLFNTSLKTTERAPRLFKMYANNTVEVDSIPAGQIGVITGLKHARTGDTLVVYKTVNNRARTSTELDDLQLRPIAVPPPVFFTSIEPHSLSEQKHVQESLAILLREDPSLHLSVDEESGQTHLAGMGDLHLEIARDRLLGDFKAKARTGKIEIGYRETPTTSTAPYTHTLDKLIAGKPAKASITASISPLSDSPPSADEFTTTYPPTDTNTLTISHPGLSTQDASLHASLLPPHLPLPTLLLSLRAGATAALARGPLTSFPLANTHVHLTFSAPTHLFPESTPAALSAAARAAVAKSARDANEHSNNALMEPVMRVVVGVPEGALGAVVQDLSSARGAQVLELRGGEEDGTAVIDTARIYVPPDPFAGGSVEAGGSGRGGMEQRQIVARVPLKEMVGYLGQLRALTGGRGTFVMEWDGFERMGAQRQRGVLEGMREFA